MKKLILNASMLLLVASMNAQVQVSTQTLDLASLDMHKRYRFFPGLINDNGEVIVKMGKTTTCDVDKNFYGTKTFYGAGWTFSELKFDADLNYIGKEEKTFENTMKAFQYAPVFGERFNTEGAGIGGITKDFLGETTVVPTISITSFNVSSFDFGSKVKTNPEGTLCWEVITSNKVKTINAKEEKGQKWIAQSSFHFPGGGDILFATSGVYPEDNISHYVLKRYNTDLEVSKFIHLAIPYNVSLKMLPIEKEGGKKDYLFINQAAKKYAKNIPLKAANFIEFIYVDGETLEIKFKTESSLKYSVWNVTQIVDNNDGLYILGPAGKDDQTMIEMPGQTNFSDIAIGKILTNTPKELPNYQIIKINKSNQQIEWVNGTSMDQAAQVTAVLNGIDLKAKATPIFTFPGSTTASTSWGNAVAKSFIANNKLIVVGQQMLKAGSYAKPTEDRGNLVTMIFDLKGNLEKYLIKPEETYSTYQVFFSKDKKHMYWACYELDELNSIIEENGRGTVSKKVPAMIAANLHFVNINLDDNSTTGIQHLGKGEYAINYETPLLADSDDGILFMGRSLSKKAKNSELVLVKIKKD